MTWQGRVGALCPYCESGGPCPAHPTTPADAPRGLRQHLPPAWRTPWWEDIDLTRARRTIALTPPPAAYHHSPRTDGGSTHSRSRR